MADDMPSRKMDEGGGTNGASAEVDLAIRRVLDEAVDDALKQVRTEQGSELVARGVGELLKQALLPAIQQRREALAFGAAAGPMANEPITSGITAIKTVKDLGFVEFTTGLVNGTFDAVTNSTIKQMDAYAKMVADIAKSLKEFQAENVTDAQVDAYLLERYPDPAKAGDTVVRKGYKFENTKDDAGEVTKAAKDKAGEVAQAIVRDTERLKPLVEPLKFSDLTITESDDGTASFADAVIDKIREYMALLLAKGSQDALIEMAKMGMARIVVTNGEILSKLTFKVNASDVDVTTKQHYDSSSSSAYVRGSAWAGWGMLRGGGNWNSFTCNAVNESSFDTATMSAEIIGQVKINFKTESFPPAEVPARQLEPART